MDRTIPVRTYRTLRRLARELAAATEQRPSRSRAREVELLRSLAGDYVIDWILRGMRKRT